MILLRHKFHDDDYASLILSYDEFANLKLVVFVSRILKHS